MNHKKYLTNEKFTIEVKNFEFYPENFLKALARMTPEEKADAQKAWDEFQSKKNSNLP